VCWLGNRAPPGAEASATVFGAGRGPQLAARGCQGKGQGSRCRHGPYPGGGRRKKRGEEKRIDGICSALRFFYFFFLFIRTGGRGGFIRSNPARALGEWEFRSLAARQDSVWAPLTRGFAHRRGDRYPERDSVLRGRRDRRAIGFVLGTIQGRIRGKANGRVAGRFGRADSAAGGWIEISRLRHWRNLTTNYLTVSLPSWPRRHKTGPTPISKR